MTHATDPTELTDRIRIVWTYLRSHFGPDPSGFVPAMDAVVERVIAGTSLRQLKTIAHDLDEWATGLRAEQTAELEALLADKFGASTRTAADDEARRQRIIKRGRIRNADEYRMISARVEAIYDDPSRGEELEVLNGLLSEVAARPGNLPGE